MATVQPSPRRTTLKLRKFADWQLVLHAVRLICRQWDVTRLVLHYLGPEEITYSHRGRREFLMNRRDFVATGLTSLLTCTCGYARRASAKPTLR
jgi:hypothetical protein